MIAHPLQLIANQERFMMIIITNNEVEQSCGICGHNTRIKLSEDELEAYKDYLKRHLLIQDCLPALNRVEREFLKSGYCVKCQELLFNNGNTKRLY